MAPTELEVAQFRSETEWRGGHTVGEVLKFADRVSDFADAERVSGSRHSIVVSAGSSDHGFGHRFDASVVDRHVTGGYSVAAATGGDDRCPTHTNAIKYVSTLTTHTAPASNMG